MKTLLPYTFAILLLETIVLCTLPFLMKDIPTLIRYPSYAILFVIVITVGLIDFGKRSGKTLTFIQVTGYVVAVYIVSGFTTRIIVSILKDKNLSLGLQKLAIQLPLNLPLSLIIGFIVAGIYSRNEKIKAIKNAS